MNAATVVGVVADVADCLVIGLATLGRGAARTIEGEQRRQSPVVLFPYLPANSYEREFAQAALGEFAQIGAVEIRDGLPQGWP